MTEEPIPIYTKGSYFIVVDRESRKLEDSKLRRIISCHESSISGEELFSIVDSLKLTPHRMIKEFDRKDPGLSNTEIEFRYRGATLFCAYLETVINTRRIEPPKRPGFWRRQQ